MDAALVAGRGEWRWFHAKRKGNPSFDPVLELEMASQEPTIELWGT